MSFRAFISSFSFLISNGFSPPPHFLSILSLNEKKNGLMKILLSCTLTEIFHFVFKNLNPTKKTHLLFVFVNGILGTVPL